MKTKIILTIGLLTVNISFNGLFAQSSDFRNLSWGASSSTVKETEKCNSVSEKDGRIIFDCPFAGSEAKIVYTFTTSDKLMRAKYFITPDYFNTIFYIRDYKLLLKLLEQKYGTPAQISPKVINKKSINEDEWASYLSAGELFAETKWVTDKTEIHLTLSKVGEYPAIQIDYISNEYNKIDLEEKAKSILKDL